MYVHSPIFQGQLIEKNWKKGQKNVKIFFFVLKKYQSVTHVSTFIFQGIFKNIVFRSVALVIKKLWAILDFFFNTPDFLPPCTLPYA